MTQIIRKRYIAPALDAVPIDKSITLVMASEGGPGGGRDEVQAATQEENKASTSSFTQSPFSEKE
ncbi:MAG: hypothetical protein QM786_05630 [Breznakibacter sp.]